MYRTFTLGTVVIAGGLLSQSTISAAALLNTPLQESRGVIETIEELGVQGAVVTDVVQPTALEYYADQPVVSQDAMEIERRACGPAPPPIVVLRNADAEIDTCLREQGGIARSFDQKWSDALVLYVTTDADG